MGAAMKRRLAIVGVLFLAIVLFLRDSSDTLDQHAYDPALPLEKKLQLAAHWVPEDVLGVAFIDVATRDGEKAFEQFLATLDIFETAPRLSLSLLAPYRIGLVGILVAWGEESIEGPLIMIQGDVARQGLLQGLSNFFAGEQIRLREEVLQGHSAYVEEAAGEPFAIVLSDEHHLFLGPTGFLNRLLSREYQPAASELHPQAALFGLLRLPEERADLLPVELRALREAHFSSSDGDQFHVEIPCHSLEELENAELYLSGMKALLALEHEGDREIKDGLESLKLSQQEKSLIVDVHLSRLLTAFKN